MATDNSQLHITSLGVGHGDATLIQWRVGRRGWDWTCLIDGGERRGLAERLKTTGIDTIDLLVATHLDNDHIGGLLSLPKSIEVKEFWGPALPAFERHKWLFGETCQKAIERGHMLEKSLHPETRVTYPLEGYTSAPLGDSGPQLQVLSPPPRLIRYLLTMDNVVGLFSSYPMAMGWLLESQEDTDYDQPVDLVTLDSALRRHGLAPRDIPKGYQKPIKPSKELKALGKKLMIVSEQESKWSCPTCGGKLKGVSSRGVTLNNGAS